jgi:hypothetical protein
MTPEEICQPGASDLLYERWNWPGSHPRFKFVTVLRESGPSGYGV